MTIDVLWSSDSPLIPTGFGTQTLNFCRRLGRNSELKIHCMAWQYFGKKLHAFEDHQEPFNILPCTGAHYGQDMYHRYYEIIKPDILTTLGDCWMVEPPARIPRGHLWLGYFPIDGAPLSKPIYNICKNMDERVVMSYFGKHVVESTGLDCTYIPHGFDPQIYRPLPTKEKESFKRTLHIEGKFVFGVVSRPNPRKHLERLFQAYGLLLKRNEKAKKNSILYLHLDTKDPMCPKNFRELLNIYGIENNVMFTDHPYLSGITSHELNRIYNIFDIHVLPTGGEGFGVTQIEAGGALVPTIATRYTTPSEVLRGGKNGLLVPPEKIIMEQSGVKKAWIDIDALSNALEYVFENPDQLKKYRDNLKETMPYYHFENVVPKMEELIFASVGNVNLTEFKFKK